MLMNLQVSKVNIMDMIMYILTKVTLHNTGPTVGVCLPTTQPTDEEMHTVSVLGKTKV